MHGLPLLHQCQWIKHIVDVRVNVLDKLFLISYCMLENCHIAVLLCASNYTGLLINGCVK